MRTKTIVTAAAAVFALVAVLPVHAGDGKARSKVKGNVASVDLDGKRIEVRSKGQLLQIAVNDATSYRRGKSAMALDEVRVGDRVEVRLEGEGEAKVATELRFEEAKAPETSHPSHSPYGGGSHGHH